MLRPLLAVQKQEVTEWLGGLNSMLRKIGLFLASHMNTDTLRLVILSQMQLSGELDQIKAAEQLITEYGLDI